MKPKFKTSHIQLKCDTTAHWALATKFIPKKGEMIIFLDEDSISYKLGDGENYLPDLPMMYMLTEEQYAELVKLLSVVEIVDL